MARILTRANHQRKTSLLSASSIAGLLFVTLTLGCGGDDTSTSDSTSIQVPDGFEVEIVAGPPLVERPIMIDSDEQGRLYVAESSGSNDHVKKQLVDRPHSILRLEDTDGDGRYDERVVFADKMMFPEGVLWHDGSLYVAAPPSIWKLTDTDDDGIADRREEWFNGKTLTNCANDLHGPYLGPDGWIYWCKGAFAEQTYERPGRSPLVTKASHIFRRRPEGGLIEPVLTGGMDNPVEVAFTPEGERFLTSTFIEQPRLGRRDGVLHAVYGGVYGKVHGVTDSHPMTGGYQPVMAQLGPAVPVGLAYYETDVFGAEYQGDLFATLFNLNKVGRLKLKPRGATFETELEDFLVSTSHDFHPTDVMEDADGSLLVVDTGAWYVLCCPSSFLSRPEVHGAIYRVRRRGGKRIDDPRGLQLDWESAAPDELAERLDDERPAVRKRAIYELAKRDGDALDALGKTARDGRSVAARRNAVWALTRIGRPEARKAVREALSDPEESVRHAATHSMSVRVDRESIAPLLEQLKHPSAALQRVTAEALGRVGDGAVVPRLLDAVEHTDDPTIIHSLTYALIEIADPVATGLGLSSSSSRVRRAAMLALDQMEGGGLPPNQVIPLLSSNDPVLRETASWLVARHVEWGGALSGHFQTRLAGVKHEAEGSKLADEVARFGADPAIQNLLARTVREDQPKTARIAALNAMAAAPLNEAPPSWATALAGALSSADEDVLRAAVSTGEALSWGEKRDAGLDRSLLAAGKSESLAPDIRADALAAAAVSLKSLPPELFDFLISHTDSSQPVPVRSAASRALAAAHLDGPQLHRLAESLRDAGPLELPVLLGAFERGGDEELGAVLAESLKNARSVANLRTDTLAAAFAKFPESIQTKGEKLLASLDVDLGQQRAHLEELLASLGEGDIDRGQAVFRSSKAACTSCHRIGYLGGRIGPDLTRIEKIRTKRDLLESIIYPSATLVRSYEPVVVVTANATYNGVPIEETDDHLLLATGADMQVRVARNAIEETRPGAVSIMPAGIEDELTRTELADLLAFLLQPRYSASAANRR